MIKLGLIFNKKKSLDASIDCHDFYSIFYEEVQMILKNKEESFSNFGTNRHVVPKFTYVLSPCTIAVSQ